MANDEMVQMLREAGFNDEADRIEDVTPEQEAAFDEWLEDPENRERWDRALAEAGVPHPLLGGRMADALISTGVILVIALILFPFIWWEV